MRLGKTTFVHFLSQVVISLAGFVATFAIARVLGAEGVGTYALGVATITWLMIPSIGVQRGLTKRISEGEEWTAYVTAGLLLHLLIGMVIVSVLLVFSAPIDRYIGAPVAELIAAMFFADTMFKSIGSVLEGKKKVAQYGWIRAFERLVRTGLQIGLILAGYEISGLFFGHAVSQAVAAVIGIGLLGFQVSIPERRHFANLLNFAKYSWLGGLKGRTFGWMDTIVLGFFVTSSLIGVYEVAWTLASFFVLVANSVRSTLFPELSDLSTDDRDERIHHYINEGMVFTGVLLIPGLFGAFALGDDVLRIYSAEFARGEFVLLLLISARMFDAYGSQFVSAISALDRPEIAFRINGLFVIFNLILNVSLIAMFGWYGAAVATLLSGVLTLLVSYHALKDLIGKPRVPFREIGYETAAALVMLGAVFATETIISGGHYATLVLVFVGSAVYVLSLFSLSARIRNKFLSLAGII